MSHPKLRQTIPLLLSGYVLTSAWGSLPNAESSLEFRFAERGSRPVRVTQRWEDQWVPSLRRWVEGRSPTGGRREWLSDRVVLRMAPGRALPGGVLEGMGLARSRTLRDGLWIFQATDAWAAARAAQALAGLDGVEVAVPVRRRQLALHRGFSPRPDDPYFTRQWHWENRDESGRRIGPDTNPRAAWAVTRGAGVTVAICDDGFEVTHPDLRSAAAAGLHYDFVADQAGAATYGSHSTCVAGLVAATGNNRIGVTGLAPEARLASWAIFGPLDTIASDEQLMDMFQYRSQEVGVQNHSWGNADTAVYPLSALEEAGMSAAIREGRGGRGTIVVRSGGNFRETGSNVNDDGYANDPRVIAVAAVRQDGRVASYSNPGACLLVGVPSGDEADSFDPTPTIFTTDRTGTRGYNQNRYTNDLASYAFEASGFSGTSAAAPQVSGLAALILSANPDLTYRDVQQVMLNAARHYDLEDPAVLTNSAGYVVSQNLGFGVPDAGVAVDLAGRWPLRPAMSTTTVSWSGGLWVPDDGLRVWVKAADGTERGIGCRPALGPHPDEPTARLPLVFVGTANSALNLDLRGKAALIERGGAFFRDKIGNAFQAGAAFAVIYNNVDGDRLITPAGTDFVPIPAVLISENEGRDLVARLEAGETVETQLRLESVRIDLNVLTNALSCEHVGLRVRALHNRRGDLRITLVSPTGTRSVLQQENGDIEPGPDDWTYWSVGHFYEPSLGRWTAEFSDEDSGVNGRVVAVQLIIRGTAIDDRDADGLDDGWEVRWFQGLGQGPRDDPDRDGRSNAREQVLGTDPTHADQEFRVSVAAYDDSTLRLSWPASPDFEYRVEMGQAPSRPMTEAGRLVGQFPEAEFLVPRTAAGNRFFQVEATDPTAPAASR